MTAPSPELPPKWPAFHFYVGDWKKDPAVRACGLAARGLWFEMLCLMHEAPDRGHLMLVTGRPIAVDQLARMVGSTPSEVTDLLAELEQVGVFSRTPAGVIYSRRMVRDEKKRRRCSDAGKLGGNPALKRCPKGESKLKPTPSSSSSVSASASAEKKTPLPPVGGVDADIPCRPADGTEENPGPETRRQKAAPPPETGRQPGIDPRVEAETLTPPIADLVDAWKAAKLLGGDAKTEIQITHNRRGWWQDRVKDPWWFRHWRMGVERLGKSQKARGLGDFPRGVRLDDFLKNPDYLTRILEGEFDDRPPPPSTRAGGTGGATAPPADGLDYYTRRLMEKAKEQELKRPSGGQS